MIIQEILQACAIGDMPKVLCSYTVANAETRVGQVTEIKKNRVAVDFGIRYDTWFYTEEPDQVDKPQRKYMRDLSLSIAPWMEVNDELQFIPCVNADHQSYIDHRFLPKELTRELGDVKQGLVNDIQQHGIDVNRAVEHAAKATETLLKSFGLSWIQADVEAPGARAARALIAFTTDKGVTYVGHYKNNQYVVRHSQVTIVCDDDVLFWKYLL